VPILLQKSPSGLCEMELYNNRIQSAALLNRFCVFVRGLESMFRDEMLKILLQQYLPSADIGVDIRSPRRRGDYSSINRTVRAMHASRVVRCMGPLLGTKQPGALA